MLLILVCIGREMHSLNPKRLCSLETVSKHFHPTHVERNRIQESVLCCEGLFFMRKKSMFNASNTNASDIC